MSSEPDHSEDEPTGPTPQPGIIRAAWVMWLVMGVVFVLFGCANVIMSAVLADQKPNRASTVSEGCGTWFAFGIGAALFVAGQNLRRGKAKDVVVAAVLSILLGLFYAAVGVGAFIFLARNEVLALILAATGFLIAAGSILPGVLALVGRQQYLEWRRANRRRRRRRYEDEDDDRDNDRGPDDRPWSRGRGEPT